MPEITDADMYVPGLSSHSKNIGSSITSTKADQSLLK
jgi:hypothetical protein